jgi:hypothetical protein
MKQFDTLRTYCENLNVAPVNHVWLNSANKSWLRSNTKILAYFTGLERLDMALNSDSVTLNNVTFHFYGGTYKDSAGNTQYYIPVNRAVITPDLGPWFLHAQGLQYVPSTIDIASNLDSALNDIAEVYGDFSYAKVEHNPVSLDLYMGSNYLYGFRNPNSVFFPSVDW